MSVRRVVALALSATLGITGLAAVAPTAAAATGAPYEVTIDAPPSVTPPAQTVFGAGTGLQASDPDRGMRWQSFAGGPVSYQAACDSTDRMAFHGDRFGCLDYHQGTWDATVHDWATGVTLTRPRPEGHTWLRAFGTDRLLSYSTDAEGAVTLHLPGLGEGAPADADVTTTERITGYPEVLAFDAEGAVVTYTKASGGQGVGLVDFGAATLVPLAQPAAGVPYGVKATLGADRVALYGGYGTTEALIVPRATPAGPASTVKLPSTEARQDRLALLGDWVVGSYSAYGSAPLKATSLATGATRDLGVLVAGNSEIRTGTDGTLAFVGGTDSTHWGIRRVTLDTAGAPVTTQVLSTPPKPVTRTALTVTNGRVTTEQEDGYRTLRGYDVSLTEPRTAASVWSCAVTSAGTSPCAEPSGPGIAGARWADTGDGRLVTLGADDVPPSRGEAPCGWCAPTVYVTTAAPGATTRKITLDTTRRIRPTVIRSASGRYVHFGATENYVATSVVADIETGRIVSVSSAGNQSLWGTWLWTASADSDIVSAVDLRTGAKVATVDLGTNCATSGFEVVGKWIYARCQDDTSAVVYDQEKRTSVRFQVSRYSRPHLGDGFIAYTESSNTGPDALSVIDVRTGAPVTRALGLVGLDGGNVTNYNKNWTIDRFGGGVAYIDPQQKIHVVGLGGVTSRLTALESSVPAAVNLKSATWKPRWNLSKPGTWSLTLKRKATGATVRTLTGVGRGIVAPVWDGKDAAGKLVANGAHTWTLTVKPADGHGADLVRSGALSVTGGAAVRRDLAGDDGFGDLLVMDTAGLVSMYRGTGTGAVSARIAGTGTKFATSSVFVPTGDLNGDRCADVYVRVGDQLRAYRPGCGKVLSASSPYTLVGTGWGQYDVLTSSGDVNGDGFADLVARQASTGDVYFYGGTADHRVKPRVRIGTNWKLYKKIVGAGDLNGDGRGDLLGVDASGVLWRYHGTATGGVTARVQVGGGWGGYSSLVGVGDLSGDGRADLLARDTAGKLWRYSGTGTGAYGGRVAVGSGWSVFKGLY
ncbi:FG-GAP-like repeat-containing protein [Streptomyces sp. NPDC015130]|uniref:FG-GAP-like repeat-containing protein n=1 Tax=Streptomyces sp. NPDC015130 TaxID=3364940 RepID=UPI0036FB0E7C